MVVVLPDARLNLTLQLLIVLAIIYPLHFVLLNINLSVLLHTNIEIALMNNKAFYSQSVSQTVYTEPMTLTKTYRIRDKNNFQKRYITEKCSTPTEKKRRELTKIIIEQ